MTRVHGKVSKKKIHLKQLMEWYKNNKIKSEKCELLDKRR